MGWIRQGTAAFRRTSAALFLGGWVTFTVLYCVQPLMPVFSREFAVSPVVSSFSLSVTTAALALSMLGMATLSHRLGAKRMMAVSVLLSSCLLLGTALAPSFAWLVCLRAFTGISLAGLPAIAMGYLGEEVHPESLGFAMGLYIS
ncbi:MAG: MFS transporter, partial [Alicyclobacillus sp.]|nr:MFS transporter [Alicyclobacillus sp.]